jgi:hypothetical protein
MLNRHQSGALGLNTWMGMCRPGKVQVQIHWEEDERLPSAEKTEIA